LEIDMRVKNINGTSANTCKCGSWLDHWKNYSGRSVPSLCSTESCVNGPEVGAHVQKDVAWDNSWYIVPLCKTCNAMTGEAITIGDSVTLVPANVSQTCGR